MLYIIWLTWTYARRIRELYRSIDGSFFFGSIFIWFKTKLLKVLNVISIKFSVFESLYSLVIFFYMLKQEYN